MSGLKYGAETQKRAHDNRLTPHGVSGLKFVEVQNLISQLESHPAWGEWIEIWRGDTKAGT